MTDLSRLWTTRPRLLADAFGDIGHELRLVGGPVRCALAGEVPKDIDLCTDATPAEMLVLGARMGLRTVPTLAETEQDPGEWERGGLKHGTVPFLVNGEILEVTTLRVDAETDGRHARVEFVRDFRADAARRDFTFNAMSVDRAGHLHDHFGGADDLARGIVRFVGDADARIREDYLRILRYYRFRLRYGASDGSDTEALLVDSSNAKSIADNAPGLARISGERIWQEMSRILSDPNGVVHGFGRMVPEVINAIGMHDRTTAAADFAARNGAHPAIVTGFLISGDPSAEHLMQRHENSAADLAMRWRLSGDDAALVELASARRDMFAAPFSDFIDLALDPRARRGDLAALLIGFGRKEDAASLLGPLPEFPIRGADLIKAGLIPGPGIGNRLADLRIQWRASGYTATRDELLADIGAEPSHLMQPF